MKKILSILLASLALSTSAQATTSTINPTQPAQGSSLTSVVVRNQFVAAYNDLNNIYSWFPSDLLSIVHGGTGASTINGTLLNLGWNVNAPALSANNISLSNPLYSVQNIQFSNSGRKLILPSANSSNSIPLGWPLYINNIGANDFSVVKQDGTTIVADNVPANTSLVLTLISNSNSNGSWQIVSSGGGGSGIVSGALGGTGVSNVGKTITLGGDLTLNGDFDLSLTQTANTDITLPTTGTLATLAGSEVLSNKTINTSGGNIIRINGNTLAASAGSATVNIPNVNGTLMSGANNLSEVAIPNTALNNLLPTQTSQANKFLKTDGTNTSWSDSINSTITLSGDCTGSGTSGIATTCTKTNGVNFGTAATQNVATFLQTSNNLSDITNDATALANLGAGATGISVLATTTASGARGVLGSGVFGDTLFTSADSKTALSNTLSGTQVDFTTASTGAQVLGVCSLMSYRPDFWESGVSITVPNALMTPGTSGNTVYTDDAARRIILQDFYLYCQRESIKIGAQHFASLHIPSCIRAITTAAPFTYKTNTPIVIPRYVCPDDHMSWERDGTGTTIPASLNWNGDPTTQQLRVKQRPVLYFTAAGQTYPGSKVVINAMSVGTDAGSGFVSDVMWQVGGVTIQNTGSGIPGSSATCIVRNGDTISTASAASFNISVSGGAATGITSTFTRYTNGGIYMLPPWAQRRQYTVANGWGAVGADTRHPQVFVDETNYYYKTTCSGVDYGLTVSVKWQPEWCKTGVAADNESVACTTRTDGPNGTNSFFPYFGSGAANAGFLNNIYVAQSGQACDADYGCTFSGMTGAFEETANYVQTHKSVYGMLLSGSDYFLNHFNDVGSTVPLKMRGGGGLHVGYARIDTPTDDVGNDPRFIEQDRCIGCRIADGTGFFNGNAAPDATGAMVRVGFDQASDATHLNRAATINLQMFSDSSTTGNMTGFYGAYSTASRYNFDISNSTASDGTVTHSFNKFAEFGTNFKDSNVLTGSINKVTGNLFTGTVPYAGMHIWDGEAKGWVGPGGHYTLYAASAPVSGTTADNKAIKGSLAIDTNAGELYINEGTTADSVWTKFAKGSGSSKIVFQVAGTLTTGEDKTNWALSTITGTIIRALAICKTAPTGATLIFDIDKSTDNGSTFTSIWDATQANRVQIAAGQRAATPQTSFDTTSVSIGDVLRVDVDQIGSGAAGADCTVALVMQ